MALDLTALPTFIKENADNIVRNALFGFQSKQYLTVVPGIKSSENVTKIVTDAVLQAGGCGWSPSGTTTITKRNLLVIPYKVQEALCSEDFNRTFLQVLANAGSMSEDLPLEVIYTDDKVTRIQKALDVKVWNENTVGGDFTGFFQIVTDDVPAANKITRTASVQDDIDSLIALTPMAEAIGADGMYFYMSVGNYLSLMTEIREKNYFHIQTGQEQALKFTYPGTNMNVVGLSAFAAVNTIVFANKENMLVGTDLENDFENVKLEFFDFEDEHRFNFKAKIGTQIAIPEEAAAAV